VSFVREAPPSGKLIGYTFPARIRADISVVPKDEFGGKLLVSMVHFLERDFLRSWICCFHRHHLHCLRRGR